jgi:hypothetical protein
MPELHLKFEYEFQGKVIHDWWTDLSGTGYVGKALKSIKPIGNEGNATLVETKWRIMGMTITLVERLTLHSDTHWTWEPSLMGIYMTDEFRLEESKDSKTLLTIDSKIEPRGMKGKLMHFLLGARLERMMSAEWESASRAFVEEALQST